MMMTTSPGLSQSLVVGAKITLAFFVLATIISSVKLVCSKKPSWITKVFDACMSLRVVYGLYCAVMPGVRALVTSPPINSLARSRVDALHSDLSIDTPAPFY